MLYSKICNIFNIFYSGNVTILVESWLINLDNFPWIIVKKEKKKKAHTQ